MTPIDKLEKLKKLEENATPGPWNNLCDPEYVFQPDSAGEDAPPICE